MYKAKHQSRNAKGALKSSIDSFADSSNEIMSVVKPKDLGVIVLIFYNCLAIQMAVRHVRYVSS